MGPGARQLELGQGGCGEKGGLGWELADLSNLRIERAREFGSVFLALALWRRLGLRVLLEELIELGREEIAWGDVAAVLTVGLAVTEEQPLRAWRRLPDIRSFHSNRLLSGRGVWHKLGVVKRGRALVRGRNMAG